jgi:hypothetical protein
MVYLVLRSQRAGGVSNYSYKTIGFLSATTKKQAEKKLSMRVKNNPSRYKNGGYMLVKENGFVDIQVSKKGKEVITKMR